MVSEGSEYDLEPIRDARAHVEFLARGVDHDTRNMVKGQDNGNPKRFNCITEEQPLRPR